MSYSQKTATLVKGASRLNKSTVFEFGAPEPGRTLFCWLPAGDAPSGPPFGSYVATKGTAPADFVKKWNERTKHLKKGTPLAAYITFQGQKLFDFYYETPPTEWLIRQAAGASTDHVCCKPDIANCLPVTVTGMECVVAKEHVYYKQWKQAWKDSLSVEKEIDGVITLKHCFEIAQAKHADRKYKRKYTLAQMVQKVINLAHSCNIDIATQKNIAPEQYTQIMADIKNREQEKREVENRKANAEAEVRRKLAKERKAALNAAR